MKPVLLLPIALFSGLVHAQTTTGIHAPVSRTVTFPVDEAEFRLTVSAPVDASAQQVKQALQNAGAPNPTVVLTSIGPDPSLISAAPQSIFSASFTIPAASAAGLAKGLLDLRSQLPSPIASLQFSVAYNASAATVEATRQALLPKLVEESRKKARELAAESGVKLGAIRAISDVGGMFLYVGPTSLQRIGDFVGVLALVGAPSNTQYTFYVELAFDAIP